MATDVTLHYGDNKFKVNFTPDKDYKPGEYEVLSSYEAVSFDFTVSYKAYGEAGNSIYASDVRMDKVADIKARLAAGTYNVSAEAIADKILGNMETIVF